MGRQIQFLIRLFLAAAIARDRERFLIQFVKDPVKVAFGG